MYFNSLSFLLFFVMVYGLYVILPHKWQNRLLLVASYFFYGCWDWRFLSLIVLSTVVDYWTGLGIHGSEDKSRRKLYLWISMATNLGLLGFFKYFNFFIGSANVVLEGLGLHASAWHLNIVLPVGISFYTFQTMSYTIDIYREHLKPTKKFLDFALFVAFFPQLVAGPIERAIHLLPQVLNTRHVTWERIRSGLWLVFWGLFKKCVIADNLALIADEVYGGSVEMSGLASLLGTYAFAMQIYCDFSGYSNIARGISKMMGFDLMVNFRNPYFAIDPSDFWRRWHISLSSWLRDYLYIPLGGSKKGTGRTHVNLFLTMLLGGLWHGAAWTFVAWGAFQGGLLIAYRMVFGKHRSHREFSWWKRIVLMTIMFQFACIGWVFFRAQSLPQAFAVLGSLGGGWHWDAQCIGWTVVMLVLCAPLFFVQVLQEVTRELEAPLHLSFFPRTILFGICLLMLWMFGNTGGSAFIYFQF